MIPKPGNRHGNKTFQAVKALYELLETPLWETTMFIGSFFMKQNIIIVLLVLIFIEISLPYLAKGSDAKKTVITTTISATPTVTGDPWDKVVGTITPSSKMTVNEFLLSQTPTPSPIITQNDNNLPSWCNQVITSWMAEGYSRATTNQLMKKDNPECTY